MKSKSDTDFRSVTSPDEFPLAPIDVFPIYWVGRSNPTDGYIFE